MFEFLQEWTFYQILTFVLLVITSLVTLLLALKRYTIGVKGGGKRKSMIK